MPESTHMLMWVMSDRALPRSFRMWKATQLGARHGSAPRVKDAPRPDGRSAACEKLPWDTAGGPSG